MPVLNRASEMQEEIADWRRHLHQTPELLFDVYETSDFVADKLRRFGCDVVKTGIGRTGVVGLIKGARGDGPVIGLRADMDALPIHEISGKPWTSQTPGKMHACGHDGHTAMLLGAAKYLTETRKFRGAVAVIFQPAEEGEASGDEMVKDGMMETFAIREVFGMHNRPGLPIGRFATRTGPVMAAADHFEIVVHGRGGHAARPNSTIDPVIISAQIITGLQLIASRETDPLELVVVTVATMSGHRRQHHSGNRHAHRHGAHAFPRGARSRAEAADRDRDRNRLDLRGARRGSLSSWLSLTVNHADPTERAVAIMRQVAGDNAVEAEVAPGWAPRISYMLQARPGAFVFIGNGATADLHNAAYDFNDEAIPFGVSYWVSLAETTLAA